MSDFDIAAARSETVEGISGCLARMSKAVTLLTLEQRVQLGEVCRNLADCLDEGRALSVDETRITKRHFVRTDYRDHAGNVLFREVTT